MYPECEERKAAGQRGPKGTCKKRFPSQIVIMQPESLINFQTVHSLLNADGSKKSMENRYRDNQRKVKTVGIMMNYTVEKGNGSITWIKVTELNAKGETLVIELLECTNPGGKDSLPYLWKKHGYTDRVLETYLSIHTYCTDSERNCYGRYNPQSKLSEDGKRNVINFDWMFEDTEENKQKLIDECIRLFETATGKSATEEKMDKVNKYAKENGLKVVFEKPEGWRELLGIYSPCGSVVITDRKTFKQKDYTKALYVY